MYKYSRRNSPNKGFHYNPLPFRAKFRQGEISRVQIFASVDAKFRQDNCEISFNSTKIRGEISSNFRENRERKTTHFFCTVLYKNAFYDSSY